MSRAPLRPQRDRAQVAGGLGARAHLGGLATTTRRRPTSYVLEMLPYPSGEPHMGHLKNYSVGDAVAHFHRRTGAASCTRWATTRSACRPRTTRSRRASTRASRPRSRSPPSSASSARGASRSTGRASSAPHEPRYYRWTQWIFLQAATSAGWPTARRRRSTGARRTQTVLANEQVIDGRCERCGTPVEARQLEQWFFRITDYADRLLDDLDDDRLARARRDDAAQLDRALRGRRGHVPLRRSSGSTTPSSRRGPTRCSARPSS